MVQESKSSRIPRLAATPLCTRCVGNDSEKRLVHDKRRDKHLFRKRL